MNDLLCDKKRPDIPKLKITSIGLINKDGSLAKGWEFDGASHQNSVLHYISEDWYLVGGYTLDELREIAHNAANSGE